MSVLTVNAGNTVTLDAPVNSIQVDIGTATVTCPGGQPTIVESGNTFGTGDKASIVVHANDALRINVTYTDEVAFPEAPAPAPEGVVSDAAPAEVAPEPTPEVEATEAGTVEDGAGI